jgi:uncharacterized protein YqgC (DUF456 family)
MEILLLILALLLMLTGLIGCLIPVIPGPPVSFIAFIILHFTPYAHFSAKQLWIFALLSLFVQILDYFVPIWGTKRFGGTKTGIRGSTVGLIVSVFILPFLGIVIGPFGLFGIIAGPFIGAYVGESIAGKDSHEALKAAIGSFIGFLTGTLIKLIVASIISFYILKAIIQYFF